MGTGMSKVRKIKIIYCFFILSKQKTNDIQHVVLYEYLIVSFSKMFKNFV